MIPYQKIMSKNRFKVVEKSGKVSGLNLVGEHIETNGRGGIGTVYVC